MWGLLVCIGLYLIINTLLYGWKCSIKHKWVETKTISSRAGYVVFYKCSRCTENKTYSESMF